MGKIYCLMGKSATGKDSIYKKILEKTAGKLKTIIPYTTRPIRDGETNGIEYYFLTVPEFRKLEAEGNIIESRCYHTVHGDWYYFTVNDGQIDLSSGDYILIMTPEGFENLRKYFGIDAIVPIYIEVETGLRLSRAIERERNQHSPKYAELCRRFLADEDDFSEEKIEKLGITKRYQNINIDECVNNVIADIKL